MDKRIKVNDKWYVLEEESKADCNLEFDETTYQGIDYQFDSGNYYECTRIKSSVSEEYSMLNIDITKSGDDKKDYIDNPVFLNGLLDKNKDTMADIYDSFSELQVKEITLVAKQLKEKGWF